MAHASGIQPEEVPPPRARSRRLRHAASNRMSLVPSPGTERAGRRLVSAVRANATTRMSLAATARDDRGPERFYDLGRKRPFERRREASLLPGPGKACRSGARSGPGAPARAGRVFTCAPRTIYLLASCTNRAGCSTTSSASVRPARPERARKRRFKRIAGIRRDGWFHGGVPPSEWFADGYATSEAHRRVKRGARPTPYGYSPRPRQHARVCVAPRSHAAAHRPRRRHHRRHHRR